jgi:hypothetical protein
MVKRVVILVFIVTYRCLEMILVIRFWFKVDYCFTINMSSDGLVYYLIFKCWPRPSALFLELTLYI